MTLARATRADAETYALSLAGRSRDHLPVPWTADAGVDDCARFCSHVLWNGKPGPISWVDNFKTAGDGSYQAGATDLQPWDVLLFDWEHNGVGNHVEFYVRDLGGGYVETYGANGSDSKAAKYRTRPTSYILGRFRPAYSAQSAPLEHTPTTTITPVGDPVDSYLTRIDNGKGAYDTFLANANDMKCMHVASGTQERYLAAIKVPYLPKSKAIQSPLVLAGFELVKGEGAKA